MAALLPALLLALYASWCGTFHGGATFSGAVGAHLALLGAVAWIGPSWRDPLGLGRAGRLLPAALLLTVAAGAWLSPVSRAGRVGLLLLPGFLWLPGAVARVWRREEARRGGGRGVALVVAGVAAWALADQALSASARASLPLGHHTLLAPFLVILLPLAVVPARRRGGWRWIAGGAGLLGTLAVLASRSLAGGLGLAAAAAALAMGGGRRRWRAALAVVVLAGAVLVAVQLPRLVSVATGQDASLAARRTYLRAGWEGFLERPVTGWGLGSVPWTAGAFLRPEPGVNPPSEVLGQLHSLPLDLAYELGAPGLALALVVAGLFVWRRRRGAAADSSEPALVRAGLAGLLGGGVAALGSSWLAVPALPLALAVAAGAALAGSSPSSIPGEKGAGEPRREEPSPATGSPRHTAGSPWPARAYALAALALLAPVDLATRQYQRAAAATSVEETRAALERAVALDPGFPLYRARLAWYQAGSEAAELALEAAQNAPGVGALQLSAGVLGRETGEPWATGRLRAAMALDPLAPFPPFFLATTVAGAGEAAECAARALLAEPRLAAAVEWEDRPELLAQAAERVLAWDGVDLGLRLAVAEAARAGSGGAGPQAGLAFGTERVEGDLSLYAFRRRHWPAEWFSVAVRERALARLGLPAAAALPATSRDAFPRHSCAP